MTLAARFSVGVLFCLGLAACEQPTQVIQIEFATNYGEQRLRCGDDSTARLTDLRFYVQDVMLITTDGADVSVLLDTTNPWQNKNVALLDLEDGTGDCVNGSAATNTSLSGSVPVGDYQGLKFKVGVPEILNHADPLLAAPPLTLSAMHWHWRSGYKFLRAGLTHDDDGYWLHLGSARCHGVIGNLKGCDAGNRPQVTLQNFLASEHTVVFDFKPLLAGADLEDGQRQSCQMGPDESACEAVLDPLGLDAARGVSIKPSSVFRAVPKP